VPRSSLALGFPAGLCVLAACLDSTLRLLDKKGGDLLATYQGHLHEGVQMDAALLPSDAYVVGSSEDGERLGHVVVAGFCALWVLDDVLSAAGW
jgi:hypothetical protein